MAYYATPAGTRDRLFADCRARRETESRLSRCFWARGYREIETPLTEYYDTLCVRDLMEKPPFTVGVEERMESVMEKFSKCGSWRLPALSEDGRYQGFVSKSRVLEAYREVLREISTD